MLPRLTPTWYSASACRNVATSHRPARKELSYPAMERQRLNATFAPPFAISTPTPGINLNDGGDIAEEGTEASADLAI